MWLYILEVRGVSVSPQFHESQVRNKVYEILAYEIRKSIHCIQLWILNKLRLSKVFSERDASIGVGHSMTKWNWTACDEVIYRTVL